MPTPSRVACTEDTAREATEDERNTEAALKTEFGVDALVTCFRGMAVGSVKTLVAVRFESPPPTGDAKSIGARVSRIVRQTFRSHVDHVTMDLFPGEEAP